MFERSCLRQRRCRVSSGCVSCHPWLCAVSPLVVFCVTPGCVSCQPWLCVVAALVVCRVTPGCVVCRTRLCSVSALVVCRVSPCCVPCHPWLCAVSPLVVCPVTPGSQCQRIGYNTITGLWDWASLIVHGFNQLLRWTRVTRIRAQAAIPRLIKSIPLFRISYPAQWSTQCHSQGWSTLSSEQKTFYPAVFKLHCSSCLVFHLGSDAGFLLLLQVPQGSPSN